MVRARSVALLLLVSLAAPSAAAAQAHLDAASPEPSVARTGLGDPTAPATSRDGGRSDRIGELSQARRYLDLEVRHADPRRYVRLDPELARLESLASVADAVMWVTAGLTLGALGVGIALAALEPPGNRDLAAVMFATSGAVLLTGLLIQAMFRPSHDDVLDVFRLP